MAVGRGFGLWQGFCPSNKEHQKVTYYKNSFVFFPVCTVPTAVKAVREYCDRISGFSSVPCLELSLSKSINCDFCV